jgi:uncharacterized membrane protein (UPF0136 family)
MNAATILWIYIGLLVVGGLMGYFKGKSKVSLNMSVAFAVMLSLCQLDILVGPHLVEILLGVLLVVFIIRLAKTKKFMPAGLLVVLTIAVLGMRLGHF